jgi:hypothetical protein
MFGFDVSFFKNVSILERALIDKDIDVRAYVDGNSAIANATADALGPNTHTETLTETTAVQFRGSSSVSESVSATDWFHFDFHH